MNTSSCWAFLIWSKPCTKPRFCSYKKDICALIVITRYAPFTKNCLKVTPLGENDLVASRLKARCQGPLVPWKRRGIRALRWVSALWWSLSKVWLQCSFEVQGERKRKDTKKEREGKGGGAETRLRVSQTKSSSAEVPRVKTHRAGSRGTISSTSG